MSQQPTTRTKIIIISVPISLLFSPKKDKYIVYTILLFY